MIINDLVKLIIQSYLIDNQTNIISPRSNVSKYLVLSNRHIFERLFFRPPSLFQILMLINLSGAYFSRFGAFLSPNNVFFSSPMASITSWYKESKAGGSVK